MSKFALFACLLTVVFVQYPEICKDMVSTNTPVEHGNAGGMAANGLNGMSASPTPGIQVPDDAALTISGNSNSSDSNFFQKVYQMFIASFGQDDNDSPPGTNGGKSEFVDDVSKAPTSANRSTNGPTSGDEKTSDEEINITSGSPASSQDISSAASAEQETPEVVPSASDVQKGAVKLTEEDPSNDLVGTKETLVETKDESSPNEPLTVVLPMTNLSMHICCYFKPPN
ncbi:hypothetical protein BIW11_03559 [Tropilaelaps mercedesae]|uniref:Uncharacterized protein n=1 Tax=Tropilaelaps mercedesae TaxID=418985 RepID=A0A1V9XJ58_9ACAR|nr:hypothetical protein BIW11_03559 [Tropilaelaps mercedesae]